MSWHRVAAWAFGSFAAIVALLFTVDYLIDHSQKQHARWCAERWEGSGYPARHERNVGCKIQVNGRWILETYYRPERS